MSTSSQNTTCCANNCPLYCYANPNSWGITHLAAYIPTLLGKTVTFTPNSNETYIIDKSAYTQAYRIETGKEWAGEKISGFPKTPSAEYQPAHLVCSVLIKRVQAINAGDIKGDKKDQCLQAARHLDNLDSYSLSELTEALNDLLKALPSKLTSFSKANAYGQSTQLTDLAASNERLFYEHLLEMLNLLYQNSNKDVADSIIVILKPGLIHLFLGEEQNNETAWDALNTILKTLSAKLNPQSSPSPQKK